MKSFLEELGFEERYEVVYESEDKEIHAHTIYYEIEKIDYEQFVTEDDTPVDNLFSELQQRMLIEALRMQEWTTRDFMACSNVAIYYQSKQPPVVPDMFLSFDVRKPDSWFKKKDKCYYMWLMKKPPELVLEIVSNKIGGENTTKFDIYAKMGVKYYIIHDPYRELYAEDLNIFELVNGKYEPYAPVAQNYMPDITLGIKIWDGIFEDSEAPFARWCNKEGEYLLTGKEKSNIEALRADAEAQRADGEAQKAKDADLRADAEAKKATEADLRADAEAQKATEADLRADVEAQKATLAEAQAKKEAIRATKEAKRAEKEAKRAQDAEAKVKELMEKLKELGLVPVD